MCLAAVVLSRGGAPAVGQPGDQSTMEEGGRQHNRIVIYHGRVATPKISRNQN
jgi:hypothetical protein